MTLMAGPIDTRVNPTKVNELATGNPIEWFESNLIAACRSLSRRRSPRLPRFPPARRLHGDEHQRHVGRLRPSSTRSGRRRTEKAPRTSAFYDEYFAVMDLPAEFYLETVERVFQDRAGSRRCYLARARGSIPAAIRRTALLTVEGERDDICAVGQTPAAQELCKRLHPLHGTTICKPASAITASSAVAAGPPKSIRACAR